MNDVFEKLRSLQDILHTKFEIENEINDIPKILETKTEVLNRAKKLSSKRMNAAKSSKKKSASYKFKWKTPLILEKSMKSKWTS
jgi:predicted  nucleic acid-binding Zn-ribbon protein